MKRWEILQGDVRETLRALETGSVQTCVTSPPSTSACATTV